MTKISSVFPYTTLFRSKIWVFLCTELWLNFLRMLQSGFQMMLTSKMDGFTKDDIDLIREKNVDGDAFLKLTEGILMTDRKSTRLNSSHRCISYAVFCLK